MKLLVTQYVKAHYEANIYILCLLYSGCSAVGLDRSTPYRYIQVGEEFSSTKALLHTLFHILGRYHEHERADREKYVNIMGENIIRGILVTHKICVVYRYKYLIPLI